MFVIGITGPSGAGKGEISKLLLSYGAKVIDADKVYHGVITPPSECLCELIDFFGDTIVDEAGNLDRKELSTLVFGEENKKKLETLNRISHKYVVEEIRRLTAYYRDKGAKICVIDAPLLIEAGLCGDCDLTIAVLANKETRIDRISKRDLIDCERATSRVNSQKSDRFYIESTDIVINNDGDISSLQSTIESVLSERGLI